MKKSAGQKLRRFSFMEVHLEPLRSVGFFVLCLDVWEKLYFCKVKTNGNRFMPTIYEYFGIVFKFFSDEHEPIHVHVQHNDFVSRR